jgi:hypothetical protein
MAANIPKNLLARHLYVTNQSTTEHGYLRNLCSTGLYSSILRTMMPLLHLCITTSVHDTSTAGTPTPTDPDLDERVRNVLSHIFGEAHADGELDKLITSVTKQAASQQVVSTEGSGYSCSGST